MADAWVELLPRPSTEQGAFDEFERSPQADSGANYVVSTDIRAFYQYVDYDILSAELLKRTGDDDRIADLVRLLAGTPVAGRESSDQAHSRVGPLGLSCSAN